jgi:tape measure domain-containing protein
MANATVGTAIIKLTFDGSSVKADLSKTESIVKSGGTKSGSAFGDAFTVAAGQLISNGITKVTSFITGQISDAVNRADVLTRFPKVMEQMGYSSDVAEASIQKLVKGVEQLPTPLDKVVSGTQQLVAVTRDVNKASDWMLAVSDAMLANSASAEQAERAVYQFTQILQKGYPVGEDWRSIMEAAPGVMQELAEAMGYTSAAMGGDFYTALQKGKISVEDMMEVLVQMDKEGINGMDSLHDRAVTGASGIATEFTRLKQSVSNAIRDIILDIGSDKIQKAIGGIKDMLVGIVNVVGNVMKFVIDNWAIIAPILTGVLTYLTGLLALQFGTKVLTFLKTIPPLLTIITAHPIIFTLSAIAAIIVLIMQNWDTLKDSVMGGLEAIGNFFQEQWNGICAGAQAVWDFITGLFGALADFFGSIFSGAWERVKAVFSTGGQIFMGIVDGITNAFRTIVNAIITGINHVVAIPFNAINGFLNGIRGIDILGMKPFEWIGTIDVPQIPLLARGGVVTGATTAIIGEQGKEAVLPLENNTDNWAGLLAETLATEMSEQDYDGKTINVYMTNEINNQLDAEEIGRVMMQSIRRAV